MALTVNHLRGTETPDAPSITLYAHLSDPRGTRSLLSYWWSIPTGGEGHSYEAPWPRANCMKCFLRSSLYIIPQLSTSLYPSGGHGQPLLAPTGRKLIIIILLLYLIFRVIHHPHHTSRSSKCRASTCRPLPTVSSRHQTTPKPEKKNPREEEPSLIRKTNVQYNF